MMWYWHGSPGWGGWLLMSLSMLVFWGLVLWGVLALSRWMRNQPGAPGYPEPDSPEQILARRFASGDITEEQYKRSLELLHSARSPRQYEPRG